MSGRIDGFDWDESNLAKCQKHGVTIEEIEAVFLHPHRLAPDIRRSGAETRFIAIGSGGRDRLIFIAFTLRGAASGRTIRPISARYMHDKEVKRYEEAIAKTHQ